MFAWIKEDIIGIIFLIALAGLLYIYKTRGFAKSGKYAKPSNLFFWFQIILLGLLFVWQPWNE